MERIKKFEQALKICRVLKEKYPNHQPLFSIERQLEYLISIEDGSETDRERLKSIIIGTLTVREVEVLDENAAEVFYEVEDHVEKMRYES